MIKKLGKEKLVLMSSHILQEIQATVDRIIIIDKGKIVADGTSDELIAGSQGLTNLHLEVQNADENDLQDIRAKVPSISLKSVHKETDSIKAVLEYKSTTDPRKDIFNYAVDKSWTILEMSKTEKNLEDIFRNLTSPKNEGGESE